MKQKNNQFNSERLKEATWREASTYWDVATQRIENGYHLGSYKNGVKHGLWGYYTKDDFLYYEANYVNGGVVGKNTTWYQDLNTKSCEGFYNVFHLKCGTWTWYNKEGKIVKTVVYKENLTREVFQSIKNFNESGVLEDEMIYI